jgi:hypothetical protein
MQGASKRGSEGYLMYVELPSDRQPACRSVRRSGKAELARSSFAIDSIE